MIQEADLILNTTIMPNMVSIKGDTLVFDVEDENGNAHSIEMSKDEVVKKYMMMEVIINIGKKRNEELEELLGEKKEEEDDKFNKIKEKLNDKQRKNWDKIRGHCDEFINKDNKKVKEYYEANKKYIDSIVIWRDKFDVMLEKTSNEWFLFIKENYDQLYKQYEELFFERNN